MTLVGKDWDKVKDQETWTKIVKANTTGHDAIHLVWAYYSMTGVREIWGSDNHLLGIFSIEGQIWLAQR